MAKLREMGGYWLSKVDGWHNKRDGWLRREMSGLVGSAPASYTYGSSLGSNPDISQKYKMGDMECPTYYSPQKIT